MLSSYPKISIVTPAYKAKKTIVQTIESIISQGYPNLEYIVIDGVGDNTKDILQAYSSQLAYWSSEPDKGQYDAITKGFNVATGEVLAWLNADDMLLPNSLFLVADVFATFPEVEWLSSLKPGYWDANGYLSGVAHLRGFSRRAFLDGLFLPGTRRKGVWIQQESTFFRRSLWSKSKATIASYNLAGDFALWCEFYRYAHLYGLDYPISGFRTMAGQRSEALEDYKTEALQPLSALREELGWKDSFRSRFQYSYPVLALSYLPGIDLALAQRLGYQGRKISNNDPRAPNAGWRIEEHFFLP